jgi:hypothetical protein
MNPVLYGPCWSAPATVCLTAARAGEMDSADDVRHVADALGFQRFSVIGSSG